MKKGAGDDPFAEDDQGNDAGSSDDLEAESEPDGEQDAAITDQQDQRSAGWAEGTGEDGDRMQTEGRTVAATTPATNPMPSSDSETNGGPSTNSGPNMSQSVAALPYLAKRQLRGLSVKDERHQIPFFLRNEVQRGEKALHRTVEDELDQDVNKTDLREAAYVFAQQHPEGVAAILREWGIEYLD